MRRREEADEEEEADDEDEGGQETGVVDLALVRCADAGQKGDGR